MQKFIEVRKNTPVEIERDFTIGPIAILLRRENDKKIASILPNSLVNQVFSPFVFHE